MRVVASESEGGRLNADRSRKSDQGRRVAFMDWVVLLTCERKPVSLAAVKDIALGVKS